MPWLLATPIAELPLLPRVVNKLEQDGFITLGELLAVPVSRLACISGIGPVQIEQILRVCRLTVDAGEIPRPGPDCNVELTQEEIWGQARAIREQWPDDDRRLTDKSAAVGTREYHSWLHGRNIVFEGA